MFCTRQSRGRAHPSHAEGSALISMTMSCFARLDTALSALHEMSVLILFCGAEGALGVPQVTAGTSLSYEFYDQNVSWEVETVCQACATHDRLSVFTPCFVRRSADIPVPSAYKGTHYETQEVWFPGMFLSVNPDSARASAARL